MALNRNKSDLRCYCCGKYGNELKPFGSDVNGPLLLRNFRHFYDPTEEEMRIFEEHDEIFHGSKEEAVKFLDQKYGGKGEELWTNAFAWGHPLYTRECRDCIVKITNDYWDIYNKAYSREK
jgi:hypothetical protein